MTSVGPGELGTEDRTGQEAEIPEFNRQCNGMAPNHLPKPQRCQFDWMQLKGTKEYASKSQNKRWSYSTAFLKDCPGHMGRRGTSRPKSRSRVCRAPPPALLLPTTQLCLLHLEPIREDFWAFLFSFGFDRVWQIVIWKEPKKEEKGKNYLFSIKEKKDLPS